MPTTETLDFDILIIGAGPAGLSCAIHLAQLSQEKNLNLQIAVLEKSSQIGGHIVSGAIMDPRAINKLLPNWHQEAKNFGVTLTPVIQDKFFWLGKKHAVKLPTPKPLNNHGNFILSLSHLCRYLGDHAEQLGVILLPGFAAHSLLYDSNKKIIGVNTEDTDIYAKYTIIAEGCRGSISRKLNLHKNQTYGLGIKEIWQLPDNHPDYQPGLAIHSIGWPLDNKTYGGSFIYHLDKNQIAVGFIVGLDYSNPSLSPFEELQRFKTHPKFINLFKNSQRIAYASRSLNEGGYQAIPENLTLPGAMVIGCSAGLLNVARLKGIDNAISSGILAAKACVNEQLSYSNLIKNSHIYKELYSVRNIRPGFKFGLIPGLLIAGFETYISRGKLPYTLAHHAPDNTKLINKNKIQPIKYPKPDYKITFDRLSSLILTNISYTENQPSHLKLKNPDLAINYNYKKFNSPERFYCPAAVYEIITPETNNNSNKPYLQINAQNCIHCKACDIKDPKQNIVWTPPKNGDGPCYTIT